MTSKPKKWREIWWSCREPLSLSRAGLSNWRPAGRMRPNRFLNAARSFLLIIKMLKTNRFWYEKAPEQKKVDNISKLRPADSFLAFECHCAARTRVWVWHACSGGSIIIKIEHKHNDGVSVSIEQKMFYRIVSLSLSLGGHVVLWCCLPSISLCHSVLRKI